MYRVLVSLITWSFSSNQSWLLTEIKHRVSIYCIVDLTTNFFQTSETNLSFNLACRACQVSWKQNFATIKHFSNFIVVQFQAAGLMTKHILAHTHAWSVWQFTSYITDILHVMFVDHNVDASGCHSWNFRCILVIWSPLCCNFVDKMWSWNSWSNWLVIHLTSSVSPQETPDLVTSSHIIKI